MNIRIYYEDTDCGGVVYYANYLKYFERGRTEYLETRGIDITTLLKEGTQFMVIRAVDAEGKLKRLPASLLALPLEAVTTQSGHPSPSHVPWQPEEGFEEGLDG